MSLCPERSVEGAYVSRPRHSRQALAPALLLGVVTLALNASTAMAFGERVKEGASNVLSRGKPAGSRIIAPKCSARPDPGGCPFTGPRGNVLFSRCAGPRGRFSHAPTPLGNRVCNAVLSANSLFKELGTNAEAARRKVEAGMRERLGRVQKAALSSKLPDAFAGARHAVQAIGKGLKQYADDPQCGVKGTIGNAKAFFRTKVQNAKTFAELGAKSARALRELTLAVSEAEKAKHAARALRREYPRNAEVTDAIFVKVASFGGDVQGIANPRTLDYATAGDKPDHGKPPEAGKPPETGQPPASGAPTPPATNSPPAASAKLWPFMLGVGSCVDGMVDLGRAAFNYTMTGSGVFVCPETAGASCVAAGVTTVNGTLKAIKGVVLAVGGCVATVYDWRNNKDAYAVRWHEIVGRGTAAATRVHVLSTASRAAPDQVEASARDLGAGAQPQVKSIVGPMDRSIRHIDSWRDIENREVRPLLTQFGDSRWTEFNRNVGTVVTCSSKAGALTKRVGGQVGAGLKEIGQAAKDMQAVETALANLKQARQRALHAADSRVQGVWNTIHQQAGSVHEKLLGIRHGGALNRERVGRHLLDVIEHPEQVAQLANQAKELKRQARGIAAGALKVGDDAFNSAASRDLDILRTRGASALRGLTSGAAKLSSAGWR